MYTGCSQKSHRFKYYFLYLIFEDNHTKKIDKTVINKQKPVKLVKHVVSLIAKELPEDHTIYYQVPIV